MTDLSSILDRLDAALEKMRGQSMEVRAICLTDADHLALARAMGKARRRSVLQFRGHEIRPAKTSIVYSTHGVGVSVPKRLSHRVAA